MTPRALFTAGRPALCVLLFLAVAGRAEERVAIVTAGKPQATVVLAAGEATRAAQLAALELVEHVRLMTGAELPIVSEGTPVDGLRICVGRTAASPDDFGSHEYAVLFKPGVIVLAGRDRQDCGRVIYRDTKIEGAYDYLTWPVFFDEKGTLHAVYEFLERYCGVRWFDAGDFGTDVPVSPSLAVMPDDLRRAPAFRSLSIAYDRNNLEFYNRAASPLTVRWSEPTPRYQAWLNAFYERGRALPSCQHPHRWLAYERGSVHAFLLRRRLGGDTFSCNHSFYAWYDRFWRPDPKRPEIFEGAHPDWFAQGYESAARPPQLCYSNPEVVRQCIADGRDNFTLPEAERVKKYPQADATFWPVVPMDNRDFCRCPRCTALRRGEQERSRYFDGRDSPLVWSFVNAVAEGLRKEFPDKFVSALAYHTYAYPPPGLAIAPNVTVQLCLFAHYTATDPQGVAHDDAMLRAWSDGRPLYVWLYSGETTGHKPAVPDYPRFLAGAWAELFRKYRDAGVRGIFFDGAPRQAEAYAMLKLADDPDRDPEAVLADYFTRMYGPAAGPLLHMFHKKVHEAYADPGRRAIKANGVELEWGVRGTAELMNELSALVDQAAAALEDGPEIRRKRFALFRIGVWDPMMDGRAAYEKSKMTSAGAPRRFICPAGSDWFRFGLGNAWVRPRGDISARDIRSFMRHDDGVFHLRLEERLSGPLPAAGDGWDVMLGSNRVLRIDAEGTVTGLRFDEGVPSEWTDHGATAVSSCRSSVWTTALSAPLASTGAAATGWLRLNCRRRDASDKDSPALVATGESFESGIRAPLVVFDPPAPATAPPSAMPGLLASWNGVTKEREMVPDASGSGAFAVEGPEQYLRGMPPSLGEAFSLSFWFRYRGGDQPGGIRLLTWGAFSVDIALPARELLLRWRAGDLEKGAGSFGPEMAPGDWHHLCLAVDGAAATLFLDGRQRHRNLASVLPVGEDNALLYLGGAPGLKPWQSFYGEIARVTFHDGALDAARCMRLLDERTALPGDDR